MATSMNTYASSGRPPAADYSTANQPPNPHSLSVPLRPAAPITRTSVSRFTPAVQHPEQNEPWDQISPDHQAEINDCFTLFDMNKDELLDFSEFRYALQSMGFGSVSRPELIAAFKSAAQVRPGWAPLPALPNQPPPSTTPTVSELRLGRDGFQSLAAAYVARRDPREEILRTFALFDRAGKGLITADDLRAACKELGEDIPDGELANMIEQFDCEGKGGVNREEFVGIFEIG